ncbi:kinase-like domain-containing protein [Phaeosphaeria sp. MPI-PUGE-AT-0046c]|nr:kinase-like domain-containing protein [Phaeosphaeria sp. MPI-PUGE-AT-0046c]
MESTANAAQSQPINATPFRRYLTLLAIKSLRRFRESTGTVLILSDKLCVKYGTIVRLSEAWTMRYVANHTSIPVPRVYCAFSIRNRAYIVMDRIHGDPVGARWVWRPEESKAKILDQLKKMIEDMRCVTLPEGVGVAHVCGGPLHDPRVPGPSMDFGPFRTTQDFHKPEISKLISEQELQSSLVFTHGDLSSLNILVSGDEVVGIVDWETAGWYPSYWEYTSAWHVNPQNQFWRDEMEKIRVEYFGDV